MRLFACLFLFVIAVAQASEGSEDGGMNEGDSYE